jgi:hypothetical protein
MPVAKRLRISSLVARDLNRAIGVLMFTSPRVSVRQTAEIKGQPPHYNDQRDEQEPIESR